MTTSDLDISALSQIALGVLIVVFCMWVVYLLTKGTK